jgi:hypothetical protein
LIILAQMKERGWWCCYCRLLWVIYWWTAAVVCNAVAPLYNHWDLSVATFDRQGHNRTTEKRYRPLHLARHQCKYLTDQECQRQDDYQANIAAERQRLLSAATSTTTETPSLDRHRRLDAPRVGTDLTILVLLIRFSDHANRPVPSRNYFDALLNGDVPGSTANPAPVNTVGSVKEWLYYSSMGRYQGTDKAYLCSNVCVSCVPRVLPALFNTVQWRKPFVFCGLVGTWDCHRHSTLRVFGALSHTLATLDTIVSSDV